MKMMTRGILIGLAILGLALPAAAEQTLDRPLGEPVPYPVDSGMLGNASGLAQVVHEEVIHLDQASWMRLYFGEIQLGTGSFVRITSGQDGEVQELDAAALEMWSNSTAYFNGDTVTVELVAGPNTLANRLVIDSVAWEMGVPLAGCDPGCCGPTDDRVLSNELWSARMLPAGCSASVYSTDSCMVSAGHCIGGSMVMEFDVPISNPNCTINHPPVADQFPVLQFAFTNGGIGNDWSAMTTGTNNLGEKAFERYGVRRPLQSTPPQVGQAADVWGYGADDECIKDAAQQTSGGFIEVLGSTLIRYSIDVTFGNSGSGVIRDDGEIVGIVTHCCCPNQGTRIDHPSFTAARESLCPTAAPQAATLTSANVVFGTFVSGSVADMNGDDTDYFVVDAAPGGIRNNAGTVIVAQSPLTTVSELNLKVVFGPVTVNPVFYVVQLFNHDSGSWSNMQFGIVSTSGDTVINLPAISSPNAFVDDTGQIQARVVETARLVQTPDGYTKLLDQVSLTVLP